MKRNFSLSVIIGLLLLTAACRSNTTAIAPQSSVAIFDSFFYEGNDDYYTTHPLPDKNSFYNPILPGWNSDPSVCTNGEGDYFLVTSSFSFFPGVPIYHSRDLLNWRHIGYVLNRPSQLRRLDKQPVSGGIFAPAISYNPANKTYYMVTTNVGHGNFFVKTQDPFGEWSEPIMLPEINGIDPSFLFDDDGRAYIVNNDTAPDGKPEYSGHCTIRIVEFDTATDKCIGQRKIIINKGWRPEDNPIWCEGPHLYKIYDRYYLMTAEGGTGTGHSEVIYRSNDPFGPYVPYEKNPILTQRTLDPGRTNPVTCTGHADIFQAPDGNWWGVFLGCRPLENDKENLGRETFMLPVKWTDDGWPVFLEQSDTVPHIVHMPGAVRNDSVITFGNFGYHEEFNDTTLAPGWMTLRGPASEFYSLTDNPGYLTLKCADVKSTDISELPFVCRALAHHDFTSGCTMSFIPETDSQVAGMLLLKDETHQYLLCRSRHGDIHRMELRKITDKGYDTIATTEIAPDLGNIDLRIEGKGMKFDFSYSPDNGRTWHTLAKDIDAGYTSTAVAGGFTGTAIGMYASSAE